MTDTATIPHATRCSRPTPTLRLSWHQTPELWCPACGRACPAPDARTTYPDRTDVPNA